MVVAGATALIVANLAMLRTNSRLRSENELYHLSVAPGTFVRGISGYDSGENRHDIAFDGESPVVVIAYSDRCPVSREARGFYQDLIEEFSRDLRFVIVNPSTTVGRELAGDIAFRRATVLERPDPGVIDDLSIRFTPELIAVSPVGVVTMSWIGGMTDEVQQKAIREHLQQLSDVGGLARGDVPVENQRLK